MGFIEVRKWRYWGILKIYRPWKAEKPKKVSTLYWKQSPYLKLRESLQRRCAYKHNTLIRNWLCTRDDSMFVEAPGENILSRVQNIPPYNAQTNVITIHTQQMRCLHNDAKQCTNNIAIYWLNKNAYTWTLYSARAIRVNQVLAT